MSAKWPGLSVARIPRTLQQIIIREYGRATKPFVPIRRPATVPISAYTRTVRRPIGNGYGQGTIASGRLAARKARSLVRPSGPIRT